MKTIKQKTQVLPKWFNGELYSQGAIVRNPFSGEEYTLTAVELSIYDMIMGAQLFMEMRGGPFSPATRGIQKDMAKALSWFRTNNAEAYMVLLD